MKLMYIDESGDTIPLPEKGRKFLVLLGCVVDEVNIRTIEKRFRQIKVRFFKNPDVEIKSNFLRYANPDLAQNSPLKLESREKYDELENKITAFLKSIPVVLFSVVIDKGAYWQKYSSQNPYDIAYAFLLERFQKYLVRSGSLGICVIDPREGQGEKHFIGGQLEEIHRKMRWEETDLWSRCPNIVEKLLFSQSDKTVGIQIADLFYYPIFHLFEYDKKTGEYWRFDEITNLKLFRSSNNKLVGYGLQFFPDRTKKDLRFFS